jgi:putative membrane protein|tara:strand:+ start:1268 stop:1690 length:423 start_codon:yes stop_codon:yes gene_type:complete
MLWIKALHIMFMVTWFAGLFYLPRLFVYHAMSDDQVSNERFKVMERKLFFGIMTPGAILTIVFGLWLLIPAWDAYMIGYWMHAKLGLIWLLIFYHIWCGFLVSAFKHDRNTKSHVWYRWFNEAPVLALIAIVILVVVRPF